MPTRLGAEAGSLLLTRSTGAAGRCRFQIIRRGRARLTRALGMQMIASALKASESALSLFHDDERGCCVRSPILDLEINLRVWAPSERRAVQDAIRHIKHDLWAVATIADRLEWTRQMALEGKLNEDHWRTYAEVDVEAILVQLRSVLDYSMAVIDGFAPKRGQLPSSFRKLLEGTDKYLDRLPGGVQPLLEDTSWFASLRATRDALVHTGANVLVFCGPSDGILFQVYAPRMNSMINLRPLMHNENIARFDRFAAWQISHILSYLHALGRLFIEGAQRGPSIGPVSSYSPGFPLLRSWISDLRKDLKVCRAHA